MPLDDLFTLIHELRERIDAHGAALRQSEALTRYALIDPLLRALGWNTADPALVAPEYKSGSGSADYALLGNGKPLMMVEAKKLDTPSGTSSGRGSSTVSSRAPPTSPSPTADVGRYTKHTRWLPSTTSGSSRST